MALTSLDLVADRISQYPGMQGVANEMFRSLISKLQENVTDDTEYELRTFEESDTRSGGEGLWDSARTVYGLFATREYEGVNSSSLAYLKLYNHASTDTSSSNARWGCIVDGEGSYIVQVWPEGQRFTNGVTITSHTTYSGTS